MSFGLENDGTDDEGFIGNFQASASTQLPNRWRVSLAYFGQYATEPELVVEMDSNYTDNIAFALGGIWGTVTGRTVTAGRRGNLEVTDITEVRGGTFFGKVVLI